jgi:hypothetical protein
VVRCADSHRCWSAKGENLLYEDQDTYAFGYKAVQDNAPNLSGVYTIYTSQRWLYVGESQDVQESLFRHLNEPSACMARRGPLSFSFELVPPAERVGRQQALITALGPTCQHLKGSTDDLHDRSD